MDEFFSSQNSIKIFVACNRMLNDKFNVSLSKEKLEELIKKVSQHIYKEYQHADKNVGELNTITLLKIKGIYEKFIEKENINNAIELTTQTKSSEYSLENEFSDETMINLKLKELEKKRSIIPVYEEATQLETFESDISTKHTPSVSFTLQPNISQKSLYKSMVINSATRDWIKYPYINGFQKQIDINTKNYLLFPGNLILPHFISMTTPFIKLEISNDMQSNMYIFTLFQENSLWDVWKTCDDIENILLDSGIWKLTIFDLYDNEIQIGNDAINIEEVAVLSNNNLKIKLNTEDLQKESILCIHLKKGKQIFEKITETDKNSFEITNSNNIKIDELISSVVMNTCQQFSLIINYIPNV